MTQGPCHVLAAVLGTAYARGVPFLPGKLNANAVIIAPPAPPTQQRPGQDAFYLAGAECASAEGWVPPFGPASRGNSFVVLGIFVSSVRPVGVARELPLVRL